MKILHVEDVFIPTAGYQSNFIAKHNALNGHDVTVLASDNISHRVKNGFLVKDYDLEGESKKYERKTNVRIRRVRSRARVSGREFLERGFMKIIREEDPDVIMVHGLGNLTSMRVVRNVAKIGKPAIFDCHMVGIASRNRYSRIFNSIFRRFVTCEINRLSLRVIAVSQATRDFIIEKYRIREDLITVIELGTDSSMFYPDDKLRMAVRKDCGVADDEVLFIYTGKITEDKKVHILVKAFLNLSKKHPRTKLMIVGGGNRDYEGSIRKLISNAPAHCSERIIWRKAVPVDELVRYYNAADVGVWPGASSLSIYDAQIVGLPVIFESIDVNEERLSFDNGLLYEVGNESDLERRMSEMIDSEYRGRMALNGIEKTKRCNEYSLAAREIERIMQDEIKRYS